MSEEIRPTAVDCQSFAGGFAYGVVKSGFRLLAKREQKGAFGTAVMEGNRDVLGHDWKVAPYTQPQSRSRWFGKGITVPAGTWIATMAREAILGQARPHQGTLIGDREYLIDNATDEETQS